MKPLWIRARESFEKWRKEIDLDCFLSAEELYGTGYEAGFKSAQEDQPVFDDTTQAGDRRIVKGYYLIYAGPGVTQCEGSKFHIVHEVTGVCEKCKSVFMMMKRRKTHF